MLNALVTKELELAYSYLDLSQFLKQKGQKNQSTYYYKQACLKIDSAMIVYRYLAYNNVQDKLIVTYANNIETTGTIAGMRLCLKQQKELDNYANKILAEANSINDYQSVAFLNSFIEKYHKQASNRKTNDASITSDEKDSYFLNSHVLQI